MQQRTAFILSYQILSPLKKKHKQNLISKKMYLSAAALPRSEVDLNKSLPSTMTKPASTSASPEEALVPRR